MTTHKDTDMFDPFTTKALEHIELLQSSRALKAIAGQCLEDSKSWFPEVAIDAGFSALALAGEVGEVCNLIKKWQRGSCALADIKEQLADELADVFTYLMNMCGQLDIDLAAEYHTKREKNIERFGQENKSDA